VCPGACFAGSLVLVTSAEIRISARSAGYCWPCSAGLGGLLIRTGVLSPEVLRAIGGPKLAPTQRAQEQHALLGQEPNTLAEQPADKASSGPPPCQLLSHSGVGPQSARAVWRTGLKQNGSRGPAAQTQQTGPLKTSGCSGPMAFRITPSGDHSATPKTHT